jgi:plasmid maintenance system antidote protein VapI
MKRSKAPISTALRRAIADSGLTYTELERATGVKRASILRFVVGDRSLRLDKADRLVAYFGLTVTK